MATGERVFRGDQVELNPTKTFDNTPLKNGTYEFVLRGDKANVKFDKNGVPNVSAPFVENRTDGQPGKWQWHTFWLNADPGPSGQKPFSGRDSIYGLAQSIGVSPDFTIVTQGNKDVLNPEDVVAFLANNDGAKVVGRVANEKERNPKNGAAAREFARIKEFKVIEGQSSGPE